MSTDTENQGTRERSVIYVITVVVLVVLAAIALLSFVTARQGARAEQKAEEFIQSLEDAGVDVSFSPQQVADLLGEDGGFVCADPNDALTRALLLGALGNGAGGPGQRPTIADNRLLQGELLVIQTYCPDEAEEFQRFIDGLETADDGNAS
ncbi:hypothetical protein [Agromyces marinus]|uniref:DUF732 domain-containing protein n=1 Tax=Agromyces marinus TaxID=1389020 RepID=A0ABM8H2A0_9MICO|nr:hypothetical protein [Agromyces marinus]UIP60035.1 hypothetical protein DSM26151_29500 [Agromyces marinus]BDZ54853.1 hypothetical protein GCM10025870_19260 [Agromyces marinus]